MNKIIKKIQNNLKSKFFYDHDTSKNVWFRAGGKASVLCIVHDEIELAIIINEINGFDYQIMGAGSNILIKDSGYKGCIFKLGKDFNKIILKEETIEVGAGILDANLAKFARINSIKNFEFYSGIPGSIGGAIKMNAGCYGSETKDILKKISVINSQGKIIHLNKEELNLEYRSSKFQKGDIIISADYNYSYGKKEEIDEKMSIIKQSREKNQPLKVKTSGSTFKNPPNNFAAKLIDESGCKGLNVGDIYVSDKHANFLINKGKGTASQIEDLGNIIIDRVYNNFKIKLEWEIKILGN